jgi:hypothetical protein
MEQRKASFNTVQVKEELLLSIRIPHLVSSFEGSLNNKIQTEPQLQEGSRLLVKMMPTTSAQEQGSISMLPKNLGPRTTKWNPISHPNSPLRSSAPSKNLIPAEYL